MWCKRQLGDDIAVLSLPVNCVLLWRFKKIEYLDMINIFFDQLGSRIGDRALDVIGITLPPIFCSDVELRQRRADRQVMAAVIIVVRTIVKHSCYRRT